MKYSNIASFLCCALSGVVGVTIIPYIQETFPTNWPNFRMAIMFGLMSAIVFDVGFHFGKKSAYFRKFIDVSNLPKMPKDYNP